MQYYNNLLRINVIYDVLSVLSQWIPPGPTSLPIPAGLLPEA